MGVKFKAWGDLEIQFNVPIRCGEQTISWMVRLCFLDASLSFDAMEVPIRLMLFCVLDGGFSRVMDTLWLFCGIKLKFHYVYSGLPIEWTD